ncbi:MAG: hypothetical protein AAGG75_07330 [Bacteroidota bacterium]
MKKTVFLCSLLAVLLSLYAFTNPVLTPSDEATTSTAVCADEGPAADLIIGAYTTNIAPTTTRCGGTLPDISCCGGQRGFTATIRIDNIGTLGLAPGRFKVLWIDLFNGSTQEQVVNHGGIPAGGSIFVSRPYFVGPCDVTNPGECAFFIHPFAAFVDSSNVVTESNESNNRSRPYNTCDGA